MTDETSGIRAGIWRWAVAVVFVVLLLVYPIGRWISGKGGPTGQPTPAQRAAGQTALQASLDSYLATRYQDAIASARAAMAADPNLAPEANNNIAVSYLKLRLFEEARRAAQEAIRLRPDYQLAKNNLAWIEREQAQAAGPTAPVGPPSVADSLIEQSLQHYQAGRFKECVDTAAQAAKLNPNSAQAFNNVGICDGRLQLWDEGIRNAQEALRIAPNFEAAKSNLAWMQKQKLGAEASKPR